MADLYINGLAKLGITIVKDNVFQVCREKRLGVYSFSLLITIYW